MIDHNTEGECQVEILRQVSKLTKLFSTYASERPFEFLITQNAPVVVSTFVQICQHEATQFNKSSDEIEESRLALMAKITVGGLSTIRSLLRAVSDPKILGKG